MTAPNERRPDPRKSAVYAAEALAQMPRLLGSLDRELLSASAGNFDRDHWGWKFRDFPLTMLQAAVHAVALAWRHPYPRNPYCGNPRVLEWIESSVRETCRRQRRNGSFDSVGPFTQDHGVTLAMVHALTETGRLLGDAASPDVAGRVADAAGRGCRFALRSREDYAFISNHQALFALAYLNAGELLREPDYRAEADAVVDRILAKQSPDGWYPEYGGPDPGYESLGISYLAAVWRRTGCPRLLKSMRRSVEFLSYCLHPDGSVGGVYGSRHTSLYFPAGFEALAGDISAAASVASYLRGRLGRRNVVTPGGADVENLPSLVTSYLDASLGPDRASDASPLPCESADGVTRFADAGVVAAGTPAYYAVANLAKGGVCRVFDKRNERLAFEDAGYVVTAGRRRYASQVLGLGRARDSEADEEVVCDTTLSEVRQTLPTPASYLVLRLLNLSMFRSLILGRWVRKLIVHRLTGGMRPGPFRLTRSITFADDEVRIRDVLVAERPVRVDAVESPRSFTAIHMGSARYFHSSELDAVVTPPADGLAEELTTRRSARRELAVRFEHPAVPVTSDRPAPDAELVRP